MKASFALASIVLAASALTSASPAVSVVAVEPMTIAQCHKNFKTDLKDCKREWCMVSKDGATTTCNDILLQACADAAQTILQACLHSVSDPQVPA